MSKAMLEEIDKLGQEEKGPAWQLASLRHDFPSVWAGLKDGEESTFTVTDDALPYLLTSNFKTSLEKVDAFVLPVGKPAADHTVEVTKQDGRVWSIKGDDLQSVKDMDDITLLMRFELEPRK